MTEDPPSPPVIEVPTPRPGAIAPPHRPPSAPPRLLIIQGGSDPPAALIRALKEGGFPCETAEDPQAAVALLAKSDFDIVFNDITGRRVAGLALLNRITELCPQTFTIV